MKYFVVVLAGLSIYFISYWIMAMIKGDSLLVSRRIQSLISRNEQKEGSGKNELTSRNKRPANNSLLKKFPGGRLLQNIAATLEIAGIPLKAEEYVAIWMGVAIFPSALAVVLSADFITVGAVFLIGLILPPIVVARTKSKRMASFETQLGDSLSVIGNCLKAGFTFYQSMESIVNEMPNPISKEFGKVLREVKLGISMERALLNMVDRLKNDDLELLVSALNIQRQVGGNLAEILENIDATLKERIRIKGEIKVMTATGRISGIIIGLIPVVMLGALMLINPSYVRLFFETTIGICMLVAAAIMEMIGFLAVKKVVNIKF
jgi:tight adherence protein B